MIQIVAYNQIFYINCKITMYQSNKEQELVLNLSRITQTMKIQRFTQFLAGFVLGRTGIYPNTINYKVVRDSIVLMIDNMGSKVITELNCLQIIAEAVFYLAEVGQNSSNTYKGGEFKKIVEICLGEVACDQDYLKNKWRKVSSSKIIDQATVKLIQQLKQEEWQAIEIKKNQEKEAELQLRKLLKEQEEEMRKKKEEEQNQKIDCQICLQEIPLGDTGTLECGHIFHRACINQHMAACINQKKIEITCPSGCGKILPLEDVLEYVDEELREKYERFCFDTYVEKNGAVSWCPTPGCTVVFSYQQGLDNFRCGVCKKHYCLNCRCDYHYGMSCAEYRINNRYSEDDRKFEQFVQGAKFKQCPKCKFWVERSEGCNHMSCRCGTNFCYDCGGTGCPHGSCSNSGGRREAPGIIGRVIGRNGRRR